MRALYANYLLKAQYIHESSSMNKSAQLKHTLFRVCKIKKKKNYSLSHVENEMKMSFHALINFSLFSVKELTKSAFECKCAPENVIKRVIVACIP